MRKVSIDELVKMFCNMRGEEDPERIFFRLDEYGENLVFGEAGEFGYALAIDTAWCIYDAKIFSKDDLEYEDLIRRETGFFLNMMADDTGIGYDPEYVYLLP